LYQWLVFAHVAGVFGFLLTHGVSAAVIFRVRAERDVAALRALLTLSSGALMGSYLSLLVLLAAGIGAGFVGNWWSFGWIWAALGVLLVVWLSMEVMTGPAMRRLRLAVGITGPRQMKSPATPEDIAAAQAALRPWLTLLIGCVGLLMLLWLMMFKLF
jgi:hypothetical protein